MSNSTTLPLWKRVILNGLNIMVLLGSLAIVVSLSYDILQLGEYRPDSSLMLKIQLAVCVIFIVDFMVQVWLDERRWRFVRRNFLLLLFAIPYMNIVSYQHYQLAPEIHYLLGFIPLLRGGYGLIMIVRWLTGRTITSLIVSYISILFSVTYFASLLFFVAERNLNPMVKSYWDALWWACMDMTTVGSDVEAQSLIGRVLSVVLAGAGMMMLPIFTAYITDRVSQKRTATAVSGDVKSE